MTLTPPAARAIITPDATPQTRKPTDQTALIAPPITEPELPDAAEPVRLELDAKKSLERFLSDAWTRAYRDLSPFRDRVKLWRDLYDGSISPKWKPWSEASAIFFPLARMVADTAASRIYQALFQQKDLVHIESAMQATDYNAVTGADLHDDLSALRRAVDKLMLDPDEINFKHRAQGLINEICQIGVSPVRTAHEYRKVGKKLTISPKGKTVESRNIAIRDQIVMKAIPPEQCCWDTTADDMDNLRWAGYEFTVSLTELEQLAKQQKWSDSDLAAIRANPDGSLSPEATDAAMRSHVTPSLQPLEVIDAAGNIKKISAFASYQLREVYPSNIEIKPDTFADVVCTWHPFSATLPRVALWPYIHNQMPIDFLQYELRRGQLIGVGTIEPIETLCSGVNAIANQAIDAQSIRNCPTIVIEEGSEADEELKNGWKPGMILHRRPGSEITPLEFGQTGNTVVSLSIFDKLVEIAFRINHLGSAQFGDISAAQRTPKDLGSSIMMEGSRLLDAVLNRVRVGLSSIISKLVAIYWQTQREKFTRIVGPEDAKKIERLFTTAGYDKLLVTLNISSASYSRELERENFASMLQFVNAFAQQSLQLLSMSSGGMDPKSGQPIPPNPPLQRAAAAWLRSGQTLIRQFVETYPSITDAEPLIPDIAGIIEETMAQQMGLVPPQPGGPQPSMPMPLVPPQSPGPGAGAILPFPGPGGM